MFGVTKGVDKRIYESVLRLFGHTEMMGNDIIAEREYVGKCKGRGLLG